MDLSYSVLRRGSYFVPSFAPSFTSGIDILPGALGEAHLAALAVVLEPDAGGLAIARIDVGDVGNVDRRFRALDAALRVRLARLGVACVDIHALHEDTVLVWERLQDFALAALVLAGEDDDGVAFADTGGHYRTSGASEMIFMWFLARSSRGTGPKIRVPIGSFWGVMSTAAFESKRMTEPSRRWMSFDTRTTTARFTSPFFTRPLGAASLMETTMTSPIEA